LEGEGHRRAQRGDLKIVLSVRTDITAALAALARGRVVLLLLLT
jgi:hypothetical protein